MAPPRSLSLALILFALPAAAQIAGRNVNMVSGTKWPEGDPFLQRQNEPSLAVSSRNPSHLLAGSNDYRTVDLPGLPDAETGDAWLGIFKSYDGGQTWRSTVHPGCAQRIAACDGAPALKDYTAGADPVVRAGTNGMFYYAGIAFTRDAPKKSVVFVSRFIDNNNEASGDPIRFVSTVPVATGAGSVFIDKPWMAVDIPRTAAASCEITTSLKNGTPLTQKFPGGNVYLAWTNFTDESKPPSQILFARSQDCGATWSKPIVVADTNLNQGVSVAIDPATGAVYLAWRRFKSPGVTDAIMFAQSTDAGQSFSTPQVVAGITPFDQGTTGFSFRTNAYPTMTVDGAGRVYIAWSERNAGVPESGGDARVVLTTSRNRQDWSARKPVSDYTGRGHQFMPAITFGGGKVMAIFYDVREDNTVANFITPGGGVYLEKRVPVGDLGTTPPHPEKVFTNFLLDAAPADLGLGGLTRRHTIDVFAAQADPDDVPTFSLSRISQYIFGSRHGQQLIEQMQVNPPNLPLFKQGTAPFMGDYLDIAPSPSFVPGDQPGAWKFNTEPSRSATFHAVWTDNRDVRPPANGDWTDYTPPISLSSSGASIFDPSKPQPACRTGQAGMRNQNIYTSRITQGLLVTSPANTQTLGKVQRAFPVNVVNSTNRTHTYRLTILNQPKGGKASFLQVPTAGLPDPFLTLDLNVAPGSSASRMVFVSSTDPRASVRVSVDEIVHAGGNLLAGGLAGSVLLNPDPLNPDIANPDIANPDIANPDIANANVFNPDIANPDIANPDIANPDIANPDIANPDIANPDIANPDIANPDIANPDIANPDIANPDIANPDIANPDIANAAISDVTWRLRNTGNTTATYSVEFLLKGTIPKGVHKQLIIHRIYSNPVANGCSLIETPQSIVIANIVEPALLIPQTSGKLRSVILAHARAARGDRLVGSRALSAEIIDDTLNNATVSVGPGETVYITLRFFNPNKTQPLGFDPGQAITTVSVSHAINTGGSQPPVAASHLIVATTELPAGVTGVAYDQFVVAAGGKQPYIWSLVTGDLPPGLALAPSGEISGTIAAGTAANTYGFTVQVTDSSNPALTPVQQRLSIQVSRVALAITGLAAAGPGGTSVRPGDSITVTATVLNNGSPADSVAPSISLVATGTASANCGEATPAAVSIGGGAQQIFTFTCSGVIGNGSLSFGVAITAIDRATGAAVSISPATSNVINILGRPPQIAVAATSNGASYSSGAWTNHDVVVTFTCTPATGDPIVKNVTVVSEGANQTVNSTCTDLAGNQVSAAFTGINIDKTPPRISASANTGGQPYFGAATAQQVTVIFTCTDFGGSGVTAPFVQQSFNSAGVGQTAQGVCTDIAGNTSTTTFGPISIVRTPPQLTAILTSGNGTYIPGSWSKTSVTVTFNCVAAPGASVVNLTQPVTVSNDVSGQMVDGVCTDVAGNQTRITAGPINVDRTPPTMTLTNRPPANSAGWYNSDVTITWLCSDAIAGPVTVSRTVSTEGAGQLVSGSCNDFAGNTTSASVTVNIDKTPPVLTGGLSASAPASGWYTGPVSVSFNCTDTISGVASGFPTGNTTLSADTAGTSVNGQCRDQAGNAVSLAVGPIRIDTTKPVAQFVSAAPVNQDGWSNGPVTVTWACSDGGSGPQNPTVVHTVTATGTDSVTCTDVAGNFSTATSAQIRIASAPPQLTVALTSGGGAYTPGSWSKNSVTVTFTCLPVSGASVVNLTQPVTVNSEGSGQTVSGVCTDIAGNQSQVTAGPINIDHTPPAMTLSNRPPANSAGWYNSDVTITWLCSDALSGSSTVSSTVSTEGVSQVASATCTDLAGNSTSASATVNIDKTPPVLTGGPSAPVPGSGWYTGPVSVSFNCTDTISGVASGFPTGNTTLSADTAGTSVNGQCRDQAGNAVSLAVGPIRIDTTKPVAQFVSAAPVNQDGWSNGPVTVTWSCSDSGSGPQNPTVVHTVTATGTDLVTCTDVAGNSSTATSAQIRIASTPPQLTASLTTGGGAYTPGSWSKTSVTVTFNCVPASGASIVTLTQPVTVNNEGSGQTVNGVCADIAGNQSQITAGPINIDRTPPAMTLSNRPPANSAGWYNSDVTITWLCSDALAGSSTVSSTVSTEGASQVASATCTDLAGNSTSASATVNIDKTPPVLTGGPSAPVAGSGWYTGPVSVSFNCTDTISGVASGFPTGNTTLSADTPGTSVNGQCRDQAGNAVSLAIGPIRIDSTKPVAQFVSALPINQNGWANGPVTVTWACSDGGSGPQNPTVVHTVTATGTDSVTCADIAGNSSSATSAQIRIDTTPPSVNLMSPLNNFIYPQNSNAFASYTCGDSGSTIDTCIGTIPTGGHLDTTTAGDFTFTVTATDKAGNQTTVNRTYHVGK